MAGAEGEGVRAPARRTVRKGKKPLSQRLMNMLTREVAVLERVVRDADADGIAGAETGAAIKARADAVGNLTRTLEKLLDLARAETLAAKTGADEDGEAERLRVELMKRLRAIDARRQSGRRLFGSDIAVEENLTGTVG